MRKKVAVNVSTPGFNGATEIRQGEIEKNHEQSPSW
jgi:hypothetical protein